MQILLDKLLPVFAFPLGSTLALLVLALLARALHRPRTGTTLTALAVGWLWACSTPLVAGALSASLEADWPPVAISDLPDADLIVVLGGGMAPPRDAEGYADLGAAADRYWHAARIHRAGRAPRILVSGGNVWGGDRPSEAQAAAGFLRELGVPGEAIVEERDSRNTRENARFTARLLEARGWQRVLLVTSASHMGRAHATFERVGVEVVPAPTDHALGSDAPALFSVLPDVESLRGTTLAMREYLGRLVYRLRGWI